MATLATDTLAPAEVGKQEDPAAKAKADAAEATRVAKLSPDELKAETEAKAKAETEEKAKAAPEKYELKVPDGMAIEADTTTAFEAKAKALGLSQEDAQELYSLGAQAVQKQMDKVQSGVADIQASWKSAAVADKEFGGDKLNENLGVARKAMQFASPALRDLLQQTRLGDHPEVIRWMWNVGRQMQGDSFVAGNNRPATRGETEDARARRMYPNQA